MAREYMIRLEPEDLEDANKVQELAESAGMTPEAFREEFSRIWSPSSATA